MMSRKAVDAHSWELHSQQVLRRAYDLKASLLFAQSGLRGYVLSGNAAFRSACDRAEKEVPAEVAALSQLVKDNGTQTARVRRMASTASDFIAFQNENAALVERRQRAAAVALIGTQTGNRLMDHFLLPMNEFLAEEQRLATERHTRAARTNRTATILVASGMALNVALAGALAAAFIVGINRRLSVLTGNAVRLAAGQPLLPPLPAGDEIAEVDRVFRQMAVSLTRTTDNLHEANREMESFSYSVSHDLRAPLRAIDGFSRILGEEYADRLDEEAKRLLGVIHDNTARMSQLIDDLLAFSRLSRQPVERATINMCELAARTFAEASVAAGERKVEFVLGEIPPARGDVALMRQVFMNLLSNAVKFTASSSKARIEVGTAAKDGADVYFVKDNGVGFDMRYADKLFGVFQRLHAADQFEGTGVGLAIVQRIIHRHGGRVWAESTEGEGSTFHFTVGETEGDEHAR
jgi:signal transduction histidine kinase